MKEDIKETLWQLIEEYYNVNRNDPHLLIAKQIGTNPIDQIGEQLGSMMESLVQSIIESLQQSEQDKEDDEVDVDAIDEEMDDAQINEERFFGFILDPDDEARSQDEDEEED